jgi:hypothetical protein
VFLIGASLCFFAAPARAEPDARECIASSEQGQEKRNEGKLIEAKQLFAACAASSCPTLIRTDCAKWYRDVETTLPTVVLVARDAKGRDLLDVKVELDGRVVATKLDGRPLDVDPGRRVFRFSSASGADEQEVLVVAGEKNRQIVARMGGAAPPEAETPPPGVEAPPHSQPSASSSPLPWILGGAGVLAIGIGAYIGIDAKNDLDALESSPCAKPKTCPQSELDSVERRFLIADIAMGAGVVAVGVATWLLLSRSEKTPAAALPVRVDIGLGSAALRADF